jgi:hypothetical protein
MEKTRKVAFLLPFWYRDKQPMRRPWSGADNGISYMVASNYRNGTVRPAGMKKRRQAQWFGF